MITIRLLRRDHASRTGDVLFGDVGRCRRAGENVELAGGDVIEGGGVDAEVFGEDGFGVALEEFGDEEGAVFGEVAAVEDEEEFAAVAEGLDVVGDACEEGCVSGTHARINGEMEVMYLQERTTHAQPANHP